MRWPDLATTILAAALGASAASGAQLDVGTGSSVDLGTGQLDLGCSDLTVTGTLSAGTAGFAQARDVTIDPTGLVNGNSATLEVAGDWDNAGTFNAGTSAPVSQPGVLDPFTEFGPSVTGLPPVASLSCTSTKSALLLPCTFRNASLPFSVLRIVSRFAAAPWSASAPVTVCVEPDTKP